MNSERRVVVVGRKWDSPDITVDVKIEGIGVSMCLDDFIAALATEAGNPVALLTQAQLDKRLRYAADLVVKGMKQETEQVM